MSAAAVRDHAVRLVPGTTVCVTGAAGYVAGHLVAELLQAGIAVRGTVRDPTSPSAGYLKTLPGASERLQLHAADLLSDGSFDDIVDGCDVVFHTASPFALVPRTADELIKPAVGGCLNVLRACLKSSTVRRVVHTSSFITVANAHSNSTAFTEADHNTRAAVSKGLHHAYAVSKVKSEAACWEFMEREACGFDLITIHPPLVIGPFLPGFAAVRTPSESSMMVAKLMTGALPILPGKGIPMVDVRDVAKVHIAAAESSTARGRYLCASGSMTFTDMASHLRSWFPQFAALSVDDEAEGARRVSMPVVSTEKAARDLRVQFYPMVASLRAQAEALLAASLEHYVDAQQSRL